jgi:hypothetical protein
LQGDGYQHSQDGRGGVYGEFSVRVLRQPDINKGFDEKAASLTTR